MPAAGTFKCQACNQFRIDKCSRLISTCTGCCNGRCLIGCDCGKNKCNEPREARCPLCAKHNECCAKTSFNCVKCERTFCSTSASFTCGGLKYCEDCHIRYMPGCIHCNHCNVVCTRETINGCCRSCEECCLKTACSQSSQYSSTKTAMATAFFCRYCQKRSYSRKCGACSADCHEVETKVPVPILSLPTEFKINPSKRLVGLEIEVSSYGKGNKCTKIARKYNATMMSDGSVSNGFECCTAPANGDKLIRMIEDICGVFRASGCVTDWHAGLHCHVDCHDLTYADMRKLIQIYAHVEDAIYGIIDSRRRLGQYSKMYGPGLATMVDDPSTARRDIMALVFGDRRDPELSGGFGKGSHGCDRYMGLNLSSWWIRGTVEFRMHHGTIDPIKINNWAMLMAGMVDAAVRATDKEANEWPSGPAGLLKIAPTEDVKWYAAIRYQKFQDLKIERNINKKKKEKIF